MRTLLLVRTHQASKGALAGFDRYTKDSGLDVTFVCDERKKIVDVGSRAKLSLTNQTIADLQLYEHPQSGWRCGDYFYYTARAARPDYDFYWLIEPDVYLNMADLRGFFASFEKEMADLILIRYGPQTPTWVWHNTVVDRYAEVYGCVYSISRASAQGIDALRTERQRMSVGMTRENADSWPNDEAFTASAAVGLGIAARDFNTPERKLYTYKTFRNGVIFDRATIQSREPDNMIYHPARLLSFFLDVSYRDLAGLKDIVRRREVSALTRYGEMLLDHEDFRGAAIIPLMQAKTGWTNETWRDYTHAAGDESNRLGKVTRMIQTAFGPGPEKPRVGYVYTSFSHVASDVVRRVDPADFVLEDGVPVREIAPEFALPYCWNLETKELLCTMHIRPGDVINKPFLYGAQRDMARVVASIPLAKLGDIFGEYDPDAPFIFILSIGRTGSTLFHTLLQCVIPRAISEPDTLTQLAATQDQWREMPGVAKRLLWHSVAAFRQSHIDGVPPGPIAIKTRSQVNGILPDLLRVFPKAKFVFMTRERTAWARSTLRSFKMAPGDAAGRLRQGVMTMERLIKARPDATIVAYEAIVADPVGSVEAIIGRDVLPKERAAILATMERDSQAGTKVAREKTETAGENEAEWLAAFEEAWAMIRPAAVIERLGLDF